MASDVRFPPIPAIAAEFPVLQAAGYDSVSPLFLIVSIEYDCRHKLAEVQPDGAFRDSLATSTKAGVARHKDTKKAPDPETVVNIVRLRSRFPPKAEGRDSRQKKRAPG